ncbi:hypothetical protein [Reichenbachiella ulvae]|uniref:FlgN protein n=1 Tax=Reichenbachiella ulvae TaxID=2980104 RepID=A0ABT3CNS1_9BACT|nr:hypothetical protein [Reichenbachiella ulvae]MCV9385360.1 hypothetical protein [Reichenbachiella ulvae]
MRKRDENKLNMYRTVRDWLLSQLSVLSVLPNFSETLTAFGGQLEQIEALDVDKLTTTTGITQDKADARTQLEQLLLRVINILKAYATFADKLSLIPAIDHTPTQLDRASEQLLLSISGKVRETATAEQAAAEPYGLSTELLSSLQAAHEQFATQQNKVRVAIVGKSHSGDQLEARMDAADDLLKEKLDVLMDLTQFTQPELYEEYQGIRIIVDR